MKFWHAHLSSKSLMDLEHVNVLRATREHQPWQSSMSLELQNWNVAGMMSLNVQGSACKGTHTI